MTYSYTDEPHATRRKLILQKYPQIKKLMGVDPRFKWQVLFLVTAQICSFYLLKNITNFWLLLALAYLVGGVANHALMLAIHEISHGAGYGPSKPLQNKLLGIVANLPIGVPMSISFKKYHLEHHRYQGDELLDTDLPSFFEIAFFTNPIRKTLWCLLQPFFYTLRPLFLNPKPIDKMEYLNTAVQLAFDIFIVNQLGWHVLAYMIGGSILAMGLHPVAGHFISEHTLMFDSHADDKGASEADENNNPNIGNNQDGAISSRLTGDQDDSAANSDKGALKLKTTVDDSGKFLVPETCSYYGPLNWVTFNVGYHVEHHDFPSIPGSRLYLLSNIAPEFYTNLNYHTSWAYVIWKYITDPKVGPFARVRRPYNRAKSHSLKL